MSVPEGSPAPVRLPRWLFFCLTAAIVLTTGSPAAEAKGPGFNYGFAYLSRAGDLDADGVTDAIENLFLYSRNEELNRLSAVDGASGRTMWSREFQGYGYAIPVGNLDGAEGTDLIVVEESYEPAPGGYLNTIMLTALRGVDGGVLWSHRNIAPSTWLGVGSSGGYGNLGYTYPASFAGDIDGDDAVDVLIFRTDDAFVYDDTSQTYQGVGNGLFQVLSGRSGDPISAFPAPGLGFPVAAIVPDLTGDDLDDVAVVSSHRPEALEDQVPAPEGSTATVTAYPGRGGPPAWRVEVKTFEYPWIRGLRLDGDGLGDVLIESTDYDEETGESGPNLIQALSGEDGGSIWSRSFPDYAEVWPAGDATGDGGRELLIFPRDRRSGEDEGKAAPDVMLVRGSDGERVWARSGDFRWVRNVDDATGDGVDDVLTSSSLHGGKLMALLDGASGRQVWKRPLADRQRIQTLRGDLDGDGRADLALTERDHGGTTYLPISGLTGRDLWRNPVQADGRVFNLEVADLLPAPGRDLLESGSRSRQFVFTGARSGKSRELLWQRRVDLGN